MNITKTKTIRGRLVLLTVAVNLVEIVRIPFNLISYPNRWLCRLTKAIISRSIRLRFVEKGHCGGCSRFGTKSCGLRSKNPYWDGGISRGCYTVK